MDKYEKDWARKDGLMRMRGFPPSKLGPGVPAVITTSMFGDTRYEDDNGDQIPPGYLKKDK